MAIKSAGIVTLPVGRQTTPASSRCPQLWTPHPLWLQCDIDVSFPTHLTSSSHIWPAPCPNVALPGADKAPSYPSWWQTISASFKFHEVSQMVPQVPLNNSSTRPDVGEFVGLTKRTVGSMILGFILFYTVWVFPNHFFHRRSNSFRELRGS